MSEERTTSSATIGPTLTSATQGPTLTSATQPQTTVRTVRIRALVIVDADGKWTVMGDGQNDEKQIREWAYDGSGDLGHAPWGEYWIEATVPIPVQTMAEAIEGDIANG